MEETPLDRYNKFITRFSIIILGFSALLIIFILFFPQLRSNFYFFINKASSPEWSPDGSQIVFSSVRNTFDEIYITDADGSNLELLARIQKPMNILKQFPDHDKPLRYNSWSIDDYFGNTHLGTLLLPLKEKTPLCWDNQAGKWVPASTIHNDIFSCSTSDNEPFISPNNKYIAYTIPGKEGFFISNFDGSNSIQISIESGSSFRWAPDGNKIAFTTEDSDKDRLYVYDHNTENLTQLLEIDYIKHFEWSPSGSKLVVEIGVDDSEEIKIFDLDKNKWEKNIKIDGNYFHVEWSPNGDKILILSYLDENHIFYLYNVSQNKLTKILESTDQHIWFEWRPDGKGFAYECFQDGKGRLYYVDLEQDNPAQLVGESSGHFYFEWSPDGTKIAFINYRKGHEVLNVVNLLGDHKDPLAITGSKLYDFSWSPNGNKIAYISTWSSFYHRMLFVLDVETGESQCLTCKLLLELLA